MIKFYSIFYLHRIMQYRIFSNMIIFDQNLSNYVQSCRSDLIKKTYENHKKIEKHVDFEVFHKFRSNSIILDQNW